MNTRLIVAFALPLLLPSILGAQEPEDVLPDPGTHAHLLYQADDVEWQPAPASLESGAEVAVLEGNPAEPGIFTMRIRMPDGFRIAPHWHPEVERVTVLSGTFHLGAGEVLNPEAATPMGPGSYTAMQPGMRHFAIAEGETVVQLTSVGPWDIVYVREEDDPRRRD